LDLELPTISDNDEGATDVYEYNPLNPVSTLGGCIMAGEHDMGVKDHSLLETREDVLVYTISEPFTKPVEITGSIHLKLFAASSAKDTDWTAKLIDVLPNGFTRNISDGIVRARFRKSSTNPKLLKPNKVYEYDIDMWNTSYIFGVGHKLRLEITSSNFPRYDRNPNTGNDFGVDKEESFVIATQSIWHTNKYPSHLSLPIISN